MLVFGAKVLTKSIFRVCASEGGFERSNLDHFLTWIHTVPADPNLINLQSRLMSNLKK